MVSVVILAYNRRDEVLITVAKMKDVCSALPFTTEIIVVDNASVDDTSAAILSSHPDVVLMRKDKNNGIAGWNDGFAAARFKYLLVLDDDSHIQSGLPEAIAYLEQNATVGILALNITTGPFTSDPMLWKDKQDIVGFFGCGAIIRKEVYDKIGGFAEWLHVYAHEWEYALRCISTGYHVQYFQHSEVIHRASTANRSFKRIRIYSTRNEMGIVYKYFGKNRWKYLFRMWANNLKRIKVQGLVPTYYDLLGSIKFLQMRKTLTHTPVTPEAQEFFVNNYVNTFPVFGFIGRRLNKLTGKDDTNASA